MKIKSAAVLLAMLSTFAVRVQGAPSSYKARFNAAVQAIHAQEKYLGLLQKKYQAMKTSDPEWYGSVSARFDGLFEECSLSLREANSALLLEDGGMSKAHIKQALDKVKEVAPKLAEIDGSLALCRQAQKKALLDLMDSVRKMLPGWTS